MPSFQPIELFWQHSKQFASFMYAAGRKVEEVWEKVRLGWCGDSTHTEFEGGWKAANCADLVRHADGGVNKYTMEREAVLAGSLGNLTVPTSNYGCLCGKIRRDGVG